MQRSISHRRPPGRHVYHCLTCLAEIDPQTSTTWLCVPAVRCDVPYHPPLPAAECDDGPAPAYLIDGTLDPDYALETAAFNVFYCSSACVPEGVKEVITKVALPQLDPAHYSSGSLPVTWARWSMHENEQLHG